MWSIALVFSIVLVVEWGGAGGVVFHVLMGMSLRLVCCWHGAWCLHWPQAWGCLDGMATWMSLFFLSASCNLGHLKNNIVMGLSLGGELLKVAEAN